MDEEQKAREFHFRANAFFYADSIDDALMKISKHFKALLDSDDEDCLDFLGRMEIHPRERRGSTSTCK